jgi:hypothetical protein
MGGHGNIQWKTLFQVLHRQWERMGIISKTIALHGGSHIIDAPVSSGTGFLGGHAEAR